MVGQRLGPRGVNVYDGYLKQILDELQNDTWSAVWQPAIESHDQNKYREDAENLIVYAYRDGLASFLQSSYEQARRHVGDMLSSDYQTIRRIAIYMVTQHYSILDGFAAEVLSEENFNENLRHELWHFLNRRYPELGSPLRQSVLDAISGISLADDEDQHRVEATAYRKSIWLSAIKEHGDEEKRLYEEMNGVAGIAPEHPDFSSYMSSGFVTHESPIPVDQLKSLDASDLVVLLENYEDDRRSIRDPGIEGLSKAVREVVKDSPLKYYESLEGFLNVDLAFVNEVISAYQDLWQEKAQLPWDEIWRHLLDFCLSLISRDEFWSSENQKEREAFVANRYWIVSSIGRLIESGVRSDEHAFERTLLPAAESVLAILLERETGNSFESESDAVSIAINSPRGHALEALVNMALRCCRIEDRDNDKDHSEAWKHFQPYFDKELERSSIPEYEFATLVANYLANFLYMSRVWTIGNLANIFSRDDLKKWRCAMTGYAYVNTVYKEVYEFLMEHGHFESALDDELISDRVKKKVIQNAGVAYMSDFESLDNQSSLISRILVRSKHDELDHLVWFFWTFRKSDESVRQKIFPIWTRLADVADEDKIEGRKLLSKLCNWSVFVDEIDDESEALLLRSASYADIAHNSYELLKNLARLSDNQPKEAQSIWIKMLEKSYPDYPTEAVEKILRNLVAEGREGLRLARETVSIYLKVANERPQELLAGILGQAS